MEFVGYIIVFVSCTLIKHVNLIKNQTVIDFIASTAGGAVEEMMETFVDWLFPQGSFFFTRNMKVKRSFSNALSEYILNLSEAERRELLDFINLLDQSKASNKCLKPVTEVLGGDTESFFGAIEDSSLRTEKINSLKKAIKKALTDMGESMEKSLTETLQYKSIKEIVEELFDAKWDDIPASARGLFEIIRKQVYELKYLKMSSEDRDMIKIIQQMINEGNAELLINLRQSFEYIEQTSSAAGMPFQKIEWDKMAKANPYCFFRLECPECHASGKFIQFDGNRLVCSKCNNTHGILPADDEIKQMIEATYNKLSDSSLQLFNNTEYIKKDLRDLAKKAVTAEYLEAFQSGIMQKLDSGAFDISQKMNELTKTVEGNLAKLEEKIISNGRGYASEIEFTSMLKSTIGKAEKRSETVLNDLNASILQISDDIGVIKIRLNTMVDAMKKLEDLQGISVFTNDVMNSNTVTAERRCPLCGRNVIFEKKLYENHYVCNCCGFSIDTDTFRQAGAIPTNAVELELSDQRDDAPNYLFLERRESSKNQVDPASSVARIHLSATVANRLMESDGRLQIINFCGSVRNTETVILYGSNINVWALEQIVDFYVDAKKIVLGDGVRLGLDGNSLARTLCFGDGSRWSYERSLHKLTKIDD